MSHIAVKKNLFEKSQYAGRRWFFEYSEIPNEFNETKVTTYVNKLQGETTSLAKKWTPELNTEWLTRHYMALKMLFTASVMLTTAEYAYDKNIQVTDSYLQYYAMFSCLRAIIFTDPRTLLNGGELFQATHIKTINASTNILSSMSQKYGKRIYNYIAELKDLREIFSYGAPSSGPTLCADVTTVNVDTTIETCQLLAEVAQLQSEVIEMSIDKHYTGEFLLIEDNSNKCFEYSINGKKVFDKEDWYRLGYYFRIWPRPTNLLCMVSEGHVEDYFGAWCSDDEDRSQDEYNPDEKWRIIFPFP